MFGSANSIQFDSLCPVICTSMCTCHATDRMNAHEISIYPTHHLVACFISLSLDSSNDTFQFTSATTSISNGGNSHAMCRLFNDGRESNRDSQIARIITKISSKESIEMQSYATYAVHVKNNPSWSGSEWVVNPHCEWNEKVSMTQKSRRCRCVIFKFRSI